MSMLKFMGTFIVVNAADEVVRTGGNTVIKNCESKVAQNTVLTVTTVTRLAIIAGAAYYLTKGE